MTNHRSHWTGAAVAVLLAGTGVACEKQPAANAPATATAPQPRPAAGAANPPVANAPPGPPGKAPPPRAGQPGEGPGDSSDDDAELVVSRDVVARCPTLRLVREHMSELDQDMIWLAVLESIAECMSDGGPMAQDNIGVSGDEDHRHIVREVLGTRNIAPTRVIAKPTSVEGAAECQGGGNCGRRVEITIETP